MKVVINACFGGFGLSPEATLELWKRGALKGVPVAEFYWRHPEDAKGALAEWRAYLATGETSAFGPTIFSPDESLVLYEGRYDDEGQNRSNPVLVQLVEEMGKAANGWAADLRVVEIPDDADFTIEEYDGREHVAEKHRTWS